LTIDLYHTVLGKRLCLAKLKGQTNLTLVTKAYKKVSVIKKKPCTKKGLIRVSMYLKNTYISTQENNLMTCHFAEKILEHFFAKKRDFFEGNVVTTIFRMKETRKTFAAACSSTSCLFPENKQIAMEKFKFFFSKK